MMPTGEPHTSIAALAAALLLWARARQSWRIRSWMKRVLDFVISFGIGVIANHTSPW